MSEYISPFEDTVGGNAWMQTETTVGEERSLIAERAQREAATLESTERLQTFKAAFDDNNLTTDALRAMSSSHRHRTIESSSGGVLIPTNGSSHLTQLDEAWDQESTERKCLVPDKTFVDRMGRKVQIYTTCPPPAQRDFGRVTEDSKLRRAQGVTSDPKQHKKEMSNADLPSMRDAPDDPTLNLIARRDAARTVASSTMLNRAHGVESETDWHRSEMYDGYNLKRGHETRASRIVKTQRARMRESELGQGQTTAVPRAPKHGTIVARNALPLPELSNATMAERLSVPSRAAPAPIILSEATPRALPIPGPPRAMALTMPADPRRAVDHGRGPTMRTPQTPLATVAEQSNATVGGNQRASHATDVERPLDVRRELVTPEARPDEMCTMPPVPGKTLLHDGDAIDVSLIVLTRSAAIDADKCAKPVTGIILLPDTDSIPAQAPRAHAHVSRNGEVHRAPTSHLRAADVVSFPGEHRSNATTVPMTTHRDSRFRLAQDAAQPATRATAGAMTAISPDVHDGNADRRSGRDARVPYGGTTSTDRTALEALARPQPSMSEFTSWREDVAAPQRVVDVREANPAPSSSTVTVLDRPRMTTAEDRRAQRGIGHSTAPDRIDRGFSFKPVASPFPPESFALRDQVIAAQAA